MMSNLMKIFMKFIVNEELIKFKFPGMNRETNHNLQLTGNG